PRRGPQCVGRGRARGGRSRRTLRGASSRPRTASRTGGDESRFPRRLDSGVRRRCAVPLTRRAAPRREGSARLLRKPDRHLPALVRVSSLESIEQFSIVLVVTVVATAGCLAALCTL